ncbi:hypothetical protein GALMADRAFT_413695 [Galerina marginata CBS 339.88]|uniref:Uncharacterized protein n=1 Tax=Galerina marginata (strain CBS 339.88) TaxID=685588 RepID=A0A067TD32_GALM3|nr:hypothetical protein GALMADRAFT_413695 [Galerina marginata CBS 339.88]
MRVQLISVVTLAVLSGLATAVPIQAEATEEAHASITSDISHNVGAGVDTLFYRRDVTSKDQLPNPLSIPLVAAELPLGVFYFLTTPITRGKKIGSAVVEKGAEGLGHR